MIDLVLKPAERGLPYLEAERGAVMAAVVASLPTALALLEHGLCLASEASPALNLLTAGSNQ